MSHLYTHKDHTKLSLFTSMTYEIALSNTEPPDSHFSAQMRPETGEYPTTPVLRDEAPCRRCRPGEYFLTVIAPC